MVASVEVPGWQVQQQPAQMSRRFEFADYTDTRAFLDRLTVLSEKAGFYPDLNFGKTYVSVTISAQNETLAQAERDMAERINALAEGGGA